MAINTELGMSVADFVRLYDSEGPFELIDGERVPLSPNVFGPIYFANRIARPLDDYSAPRSLGQAFVEATFILTPADNPNWVKGSRVPDVSFYRAERLAAYIATQPEWEARPLALVPDLAVEVVSPTDAYADVLRKARLYRQDGVRLIWVVEPSERVITIYAPDSEQQTTLTGDDRLTAADLLPGFDISIAQLFA